MKSARTDRARRLRVRKRESGFAWLARPRRYEPNCSGQLTLGDAEVRLGTRLRRWLKSWMLGCVNVLCLAERSNHSLPAISCDAMASGLLSLTYLHDFEGCVTLGGSEAGKLSSSCLSNLLAGFSSVFFCSFPFSACLSCGAGLNLSVIPISFPSERLLTARVPDGDGARWCGLSHLYAKWLRQKKVGRLARRRPKQNKLNLLANGVAAGEPFGERAYDVVPAW